jgi:hypothetical protein
MSVSVEVSELQAKTAEYGPIAYLVTVGEGGGPHLVSVLTSWDGDSLRVAAGNTTTGNVARSGAVTLLWAGRPGEDYCLIVDGEGAVVDAGGVVLIRPLRAVLHRLAQADGDLPSCIKLLDAR